MLYKPFQYHSHNLIWYTDILMWYFGQRIQYTAVFGMNLLVLIIFNILIMGSALLTGWAALLFIFGSEMISYFPSRSMCSMVQLSTCSRTDIFPAGSGLLSQSALQSHRLQKQFPVKYPPRSCQVPYMLFHFKWPKTGNHLLTMPWER